MVRFQCPVSARFFGFYTGRTRVLLDVDTRYVNLSGPADIQPGRLVRIHSTEDSAGNLVARVVEEPKSGGLRRSASLQDMDTDELLRHEGTVREMDDNSLVVADMAYTITGINTGIIPAREGSELLSKLLALHSGPDSYSPRAEAGDLYTNREAWLETQTPATGWLGAGRARREATTTAVALSVITRS